jgi:hypothetical protein
MRRLLLTLLVALLVLPAAALAGSLAPGDGTLVVQEANGKITVTGRGTIWGRLDRGTLLVVDYNRNDSLEPQVNGAEKSVPTGVDGKWQYWGDNIRFRFFGGPYKLVFSGASGVDLSAVGRGTVTLVGQGPSFMDDYGDYSVNGSKFQPLTLLPVSVAFGATDKNP